MKKRLISLFLTIVMACAIMPSAFAASDEAVSAANALYGLGLFQGTGTDANGNPIFDLDRAPTRHEAVTMLVRLLGKDAEAKAGTWATPFVDVADWAKPYVGYAYANGLTSGTSATTFGGNAIISASQYLTFVLRALGYASGTDFQWDKAWELSDQLGFTSGQYHATSAFTRGDVAMISNNALSAKLKGQEKVLKETLNLQGGNEQNAEQNGGNAQEEFLLDGIWVSRGFAMGSATISEIIFAGNTYTRAANGGGSGGSYESGTFTLKDGVLEFSGIRQSVSGGEYSEKDMGYDSPLTILSADEIKLSFGKYTRSDTIACTEDLRELVEEAAKESENKIVCYSRFPEVPDFGALIGIKYDKYVPNAGTGGYYYDLDEIEDSDYSEDFAGMYGEALAKCGFKYTRTSSGEFPTVWFHNSAGTAVAFGGVADLKALKFYYQIFIIPA